MKIIMLSSWFFEYTIELSNALSKVEDIDLTLIMPKDTIKNHLGDNWNNLLDTNINLSLFNYGHVKSVGNILMAPFNIYAIVKYINNINPDIIHIQESGNLFLLVASFFITKYPIISTNHDVKPHIGYEKGFIHVIREVARKVVTMHSNKIIVHGEYLKKAAITYLHIQADDIYIVPHGEFSIFTKFNDKKEESKEEQNSILFFGRIAKYKGLDYLIKAEPMISKIIPKLKIIIAGSGDYFQECKNLMVNRDRFECHIRYIPNEEIAELFNRASIVVLPYIEASQSGVIPIAYAFKKAVVVTNVGCLPEVVDDGQTGFIVPPGDPNAIAKAIIKLLSDDELRKGMGKNGYKKMRNELSWDKIAEKTIGVYKSSIRAGSCK